MTVGTKINAGYLLAMVFILATGTATYYSSEQANANSQLLHRAFESRNLEQGILVSLLDAEVEQRSYLLHPSERLLEPYQQVLKLIDSKLADLKEINAAEAGKLRRIELLEPMIREKITEWQTSIELARSNVLDLARQLATSEKSRRTTEDIRHALDRFEAEAGAALKLRTATERDTDRATMLIAGVGSLLSVFVLAFTGYFVSRNISLPLRSISGFAERIASGDLSKMPDVVLRNDELGVLSETFARMAATLRNQASEINEGITALAALGSEMSAMTAQLASNTAETATAITQCTTTVEEVKQTTQLATQKARSVADMAQRAMQTSRSGAKAVDENTAMMGRIREQIDSVAQSIVRLTEQTQAIGEIAATVSDLADQSNLLAVNASIEAARAGEQGKGFSVVAEEIRSLAERSKRATVQVRSILNDIQKATGGAVMAIERGNKAAESGIHQASQAGEAIRTLTDNTTEAAQAAAQIAASSQQQSTGMDQVALAMESIKKASTQAADSTRQADLAARNINDLGMRLKRLMERSRI